MLKTYLSKFTVDILPSIVATIIGAYIVNYYIVPKAREATQPKPAAIVAAPASEAAPAAEAVSLSETKDEPSAAEKAAAKSEIKSESAGAPPADRKHQPAAREKAASSEERRNATDLARAAIARLRGSNAPESPRAGADSPRVDQPAPRVEASVAPVQAQPVAPQPQPVALQPALQPLPPAVTIATPKTENFKTENSNGENYEQRGNADAAGVSASRRPTPPGEIPSAPLDLRAHVEAERSRAAAMADDFVSATKSMFNSVIPR